MLDELIRKADATLRVPADSAAEYDSQKHQMAEFVNEVMRADPRLQELTGNNPVDVMLNNHSNHAVFMSNVFAFNQYELLARTIVWVYRSYHSRGFSFDYFPAELRAWKDAVKAHMPANAGAIIAVYDWMLANHDTFILLALADEDNPNAAEPSHRIKERDLYLKHLLNGDRAAAAALAKEMMSSEADMADFYLLVLQPAMYEIGKLWESGEITIAQEHLASAISSRVMAEVAMSMPLHSHSKGIAIVTAAPNEFHELGAWMLSDLLQADGWQVKYLGANQPVSDLVKLAVDSKAIFVAISVTMSFNLNTLSEMIAALRAEPLLKGLKIMAGGSALNFVPGLWRSLGADASARDAAEAVRIAAEWAERG